MHAVFLAEAFLHSLIARMPFFKNEEIHISDHHNYYFSHNPHKTGPAI